MDIEEQIRKAIEEGQFDNLPGTGKPLKLTENPFESPEWSLAYRILRNGGFSLPWIETRREIEENLAAARAGLRRVLEWFRVSENHLDNGLRNAEWERSKAVFATQIIEINRQIQRYNLEVPSPRFQLVLLKAEQEIELTISSPSDTLTNT